MENDKIKELFINNDNKIINKFLNINNKQILSIIDNKFSNKKNKSQKQQYQQQQQQQLLLKSNMKDILKLADTIKNTNNNNQNSSIKNIVNMQQQQQQNTSSDNNNNNDHEHHHHHQQQQSQQTPEINSELRIIIIDENWSQYCYRIKINTPFGKLINRFCQQVRKTDNKSVLFWYHGRLVEDDDTPRTLNIKDNEVILAHYIK